MSETDKSIPRAADDVGAYDHDATRQSTDETSDSAERQKNTLRENRRWWFKLVLQPALFLACGAMLIVALGIAQRLGFISAGAGSQGRTAAEDINTRYICPMMCTPPHAEPGRCPVCAMELVPATSGAGTVDPRSVHIAPASRRVANIHTVR